MKPKLFSRSLVLSSITLSVLGGSAAQAADYYWDSNGSSISPSRLGDTGSLVWGTSANVVTISNPMGRAFLGGTVAGANTATTSADSILFGTEGMGLGATASTIGVVAGGRTINNITFGTGQANEVTLSGGGGSITLAINVAVVPSIRVNNTSNTIGAVLAGTSGMTKAGAGTLILTGANTYTGTTTITGGGILQVGNGSTGNLFNATPSALTFNTGGGTFNVAQANGSSQSMGALTFGAGSGTVTSTAASGSATQTLTFASLAARTLGASGNFVLAGNTAAADNKIVITGAAAGTLLDRGLFFGGNSFAGYDSGGFVRAYGSGDTDFVSLASAATFGSRAAADNVALTGNITAQDSTTTFNTLNLGANNVTINDGIIVNVGAVLSSGSSNAVIGTGATGGIRGTTAVNGELLIRVDGAGDQLTVGRIANNGASTLTKTGDGTLILNAANAYTGVTTINSGTLAVSGGSAISDSGSVVLANSTAAVFRLDGNETIGNISGGGISANGVNLTGGFSGASVNVQANTLTLSDNTSTTFGGTFSGTSAGGIIKSGSGTLTLTNPNTFAGSITLNAGTLKLTAASNASVVYAISSGGAFNINNGATLNFAPTNVLAYSGGGSTSGYTFSNAININSGTGNLNLSGGAVNEQRSVFTGSVTGGTTGAQTLGVAFQGDRQAVLFTGVIADGAGGTLGLNANFRGGAAAAPAYLSLRNTNTFSGPITVTSTLTTSTSYLVIGGEGYSASGSNTKSNIEGSGSLGSGNYTNTISLSANTALNYLSSANQVLGGQISGAGALLKEGSGTLTLSVGNSYTGATTVNSGSLIINGSTATTSIVSVASGATLGGNGTVGGNTTILGNLSPGTSPGTLSFTNNLSLNSGATYIFEGGDLAAVGQTLTLTDNWTLALGTGFQDGGQVLLFTYGSLAASPDLIPTFDTAGLGFTPTGALSLTDNGAGSIFLNGISAIPEPSTALLGGLGLLALLRRRR